MSDHALPVAARYAVYLTPEAPWYTLGSRWLGRDAWTGQALSRDLRHLTATPDAAAHAAAAPDAAAAAGADVEDGVPDDATLARWTAAPRHYGLHATLKPPFRLADGRTPPQLDAALRALARRHIAFPLALRLAPLRGFLAWQAAGDATALASLHALADACVSELDDFRAPAAPAELARRRGGGLSPAQDANLLRWGYPYVMDTFTFHVTLTTRLDDAEMAVAERILARIIAASAPLPETMPVRAITVFTQPTPEAPFVIARQYGFDGRTRDGVGAQALGEPT